MLILATALGKVLANSRGLKRLQLPRELGDSFAVDLVRECNRQTGSREAAIIALAKMNSADFISPERAAELRSREDGGPAKALVVNFVDEYREWNTLEPFRLVNPSLLPGGLIGGSDAELAIDQVSEAIAGALVDQGKIRCDASEAAKLMTRLASYLAHAYATVGNGETAWDSAWWVHWDLAMSTFVEVLDSGDGDFADLEDFAIALFASAGMPVPSTPSLGYQLGHGPPAYAKIIQESWNTEAECSASARDLAQPWIRQASDRTVVDFPLVQLFSRGDFVDVLSRRGHSIGAVTLLGGATLGRAAAWALADEDTFFARRAAHAETSILGLGDSEVPYELARLGDKKAMHVLSIPRAEVDGGYLELGAYIVTVEGGHEHDAGLIDLACSPSMLKARLVGEPKIVGGSTQLKVNLGLQLPKSLSSWREAPYRLDVTLKGDGERASVAPAPLNLYVPFPEATSVLVYESKKGRVDGRRFQPPNRSCVLQSGRVEVGDNDSASREIQVPANVTRVNAYAIGQPSGGDVTWHVLDLANVDASSAIDAQVQDGIALCSGGDGLRVVPDEQTSRPVSPIIAAALDTISSDDPGEEDEFKASADPRWLVEAWQGSAYLSSALTTETKASLGQVHFAVDWLPDSDDILLHPSGVYTLGGIDPVVKLQAEAPGLDQVTEFWSAFEDLQLASFAEGREAPTASWPSKLDLRQLSATKVTRYLDAYRGLLEVANTGPQYRLAAYPFSCVAFSKVEGKVRGIALTALHPIRLAWNWAAQQAAKNASDQLGTADATNLLRFMDGSELPCAGPPLSPGEAFMAAPLSPGLGSLFSTWSFIGIPGAITGEHAPQMGGFPFPAGAVSGLNADSVCAAIRDYLRVNPFVTSLDVGLYSMKSKARSRELDDAIVRQLDPLLGGDVGNLPGGLTVIDSTKREGAPPARQEVLGRVMAAQEKRQVADAAGARLTAPFAWTATESDDVEVDVRFVEDPLVSLSIEPTSEDAAGHSVVPTLPIARRNLWEHPSGAPAVNYAELGDGQGRLLPSFTKAVDELEKLAKGATAIMRIAAVPAAATLTDRKAKWLVAGNMNLDPRALAGALEEMGTGAVLWEWRPPYMERRVSGWDSVVPARPYAVIANPSPDFIKQVKSCIEGIAGKDCSTSAEAVLTELGTRGIGLASLLSMGHQQSRGAIGFYLGFRVLAEWEGSGPADSVRMVLPLDAVNPVLQLLAGAGGTADITRKADMLLLEAKKKGDRFSLRAKPIELKMHATHEGAAHDFPSAESSAVKDAIEQLVQSRQVLERLEERLGIAGEVPLLQSATAALLETSLSLSKANSGSLARELLAAAADGRVDMSADAGVLLWFDARASHEGLPYNQATVDGGEQALMVDPCLFLGKGEDHNTKAVAVLLEAMLGSGVSGEGTRDTELEPGDSDVDDAAESGAAEDRGSVDEPVSEGSDANAVVSEPVTGSGPLTATDAPPSASEGMPAHLGWVKEGLAEEPLLFDPRDTRINQLNMGVVGDLGTGKTQFLMSLVYQLTRPVSTQAAPPKAFVFDYKKDYVQEGFVRLANARVLDPSSSPIPLNFFSLPSNAGKFEIATRALLFADTIDKIYSIGPNQHQALRSAVLDSYTDAGGSPMLADVLDRYVDGTSSKDSVTSALSLMVDFGLFESDSSKLISFDELFDRNVVLALGNIADAGLQVQNLLVTLFLNLLHVEYMKKRKKMPFIKGQDGITRRTIDSFVLVDEAHNIMNYEFESLRKLMLEGREFGMGVILSSQYLSHFKTKKTNWAEPLLTWAIHKVPNVTPAELSKLGLKKDLDSICDRISSLEVHRSFFKTTIGRARDGAWLREKPFYEFLEAES